MWISQPLARSARAGGAAVHGPITQGEFLDSSASWSAPAGSARLQASGT
jgi:hypothetical protein